MSACQTFRHSMCYLSPQYLFRWEDEQRRAVVSALNVMYVRFNHIQVLKAIYYMLQRMATLTTFQWFVWGSLFSIHEKCTMDNMQPPTQYHHISTYYFFKAISFSEPTAHCKETRIAGNDIYLERQALAEKCISFVKLMWHIDVLTWRRLSR